MRTVLQFHVPPTKEDERKIWNAQKLITQADLGVADDEMVEDAGLDDGADTLETRPCPQQNVA